MGLLETAAKFASGAVKALGTNPIVTTVDYLSNHPNSAISELGHSIQDIPLYQKFFDYSNSWLDGDDFYTGYLSPESFYKQLAAHESSAAAADRAFQQGSADKAMQFSALQAAENRAFQQASADKAMQFSADQAQKQMNFQERMANTSYQRVVKDLQAAGLNPILAYTQGGASVPAGSSASGASASGSSASGVSAAGSKEQVVAISQGVMDYMQGAMTSAVKLIGDIIPDL